jgi:hypothetical protein
VGKPYPPKHLIRSPIQSRIDSSVENNQPRHVTSDREGVSLSNSTFRLGGQMKRLFVFSLLTLIANSNAYAQLCPNLSANVCSLTNFQPIPPSPGAKTNPLPSCDATNTATSLQKLAIQSVIDRSPSVFNTDLCALSNIFVVSGSEHSWGKWADPNNHPQNDTNKTYVAIHQNDFELSFSSKQDAHLEANPLLVDLKQAHHEEDLSSLSKPTVAEFFGIFYALAHEMGHIKWHQNGNGSAIKCPNDSNKLFNSYSWSDLGDAGTASWRGFADNQGTAKNNVPKPHKANGNDLNKIYTNGFVTALAAANPEEDFVETYSITMLRTICDECIFNIKISGNQIRVNDSRDHPDLMHKFDCVTQFTR